MLTSRPMLACIGMIVLISCSNNDNAYRIPENIALSPTEVPLYNGTAGVTSGTTSGLLRARTPVYMTSDTYTHNDHVFERILIEDSSAYVPAGWMMHNAKISVLVSEREYQQIDTYSDAELTNPALQVAYWKIVVSGPGTGKSTPIMERQQNGVAIFYVPAGLVSSDSLSVDFYTRYEAARLGGDGSIAELLTDQRYSSLREYGWAKAKLDAAELEAFNNTDNGDPGTEGDEVYAEGDGEYGDYPSENDYEPFKIEQDWMRDYSVLGPDESPGEITKFFILEDGTEMDATDHTLANGYPYREGNAPGTKAVKKIRFQMIPKRKMNIRFEVNTYYDPDPTQNTSFDQDFKNAEPDKVYSIILENTPGSMVFCSIMRVVIKVEEISAASTVSGECGD